MLKLSEAILLGSTQIKPMAGSVLCYDHNGEAYGCALGMAGVAEGGEERHHWLLDTIWPILRQKTNYPCECFPEYEQVLQTVITHLFDAHVINKEDWTLEQLVDFVRKVEDEHPSLTIAEQKKPCQGVKVEENSKENKNYVLVHSSNS